MSTAITVVALVCIILVVVMIILTILDRLDARRVQPPPDPLSLPEPTWFAAHFDLWERELAQR